MERKFLLGSVYIRRREHLFGEKSSQAEMLVLPDHLCLQSVFIRTIRLNPYPIISQWLQPLATDFI